MISELQEEVRRFRQTAKDASDGNLMAETRRFGTGTVTSPSISEGLSELREQSAQGFDRLARMVLTPRPQRSFPELDSPIVLPFLDVQPLSPQRLTRTWTYGTPEMDYRPQSPRGSVSEASFYRRRPQYQPATSSPASVADGRPLIQPIRCYNCNNVGHIKRACPYPLSNTSLMESEAIHPVLENHRRHPPPSDRLEVMSAVARSTWRSK